MIACSLRTDPSGRVYCYTHDSPTVPLRPTCGGVLEREGQMATYVPLGSSCVFPITLIAGG